MALIDNHEEGRDDDFSHWCDGDVTTRNMMLMMMVMVMSKVMMMY